MSTKLLLSLVPVEEAKPELPDKLSDCKIELVKPFELSIIIKINILFYYKPRNTYLKVNKYKNLFKSPNISSRMLNRSELLIVVVKTLLLFKLTK